jgi:tetratricopeptide (TPR) repeat protein
MSKVINYNYERKNMTFDVTTLFVLDTIEIIDYQKSDFYLELKQQPIDFTDRNKKKLEEAINAYVDLKFNFRLRYFIELPLLISNGIEIIQLLENNYLTEEISKGTIKRYRNNELSELMTIGKEIDEIIDIIKTDDHNKQTYDISERGINKFGYILMSQEKNNEALQIFKLNTELFPNQYNTYNSYGECLLKVSDEKNAIIAYKKSLELKADNTKAKNALDRLK